MQLKINNTVICLRMEKNLMAKTPPGDFQVTTPEAPLLSQQTVTTMTTRVNGSTQQRLNTNQSVPALIPLDRPQTK